MNASENFVEPESDQKLAKLINVSFVISLFGVIPLIGLTSLIIGGPQDTPGALLGAYVFLPIILITLIPSLILSSIALWKASLSDLTKGQLVKMIISYFLGLTTFLVGISISASDSVFDPAILGFLVVLPVFFSIMGCVINKKLFFRLSVIITIILAIMTGISILSSFNII